MPHSSRVFSYTPLCESGTCTLREALIIGSVLVKNSIPMVHSSTALLQDCRNVLHISKQHLPPNASRDTPALQSHRCRLISLPQIQERFSSSTRSLAPKSSDVRPEVQGRLVGGAEGSYFRASALQDPPRYHS